MQSELTKMANEDERSRLVRVLGKTQNSMLLPPRDMFERDDSKDFMQQVGRDLTRLDLKIRDARREDVALLARAVQASPAGAEASAAVNEESNALQTINSTLLIPDRHP